MLGEATTREERFVHLQIKIEITEIFVATAVEIFLLFARVFHPTFGLIATDLARLLIVHTIHITDHGLLARFDHCHTIGASPDIRRRVTFFRLVLTSGIEETIRWPCRLALETVDEEKNLSYESIRFDEIQSLEMNDVTHRTREKTRVDRAFSEARYATVSHCHGRRHPKESIESIWFGFYLHFS